MSGPRIFDNSWINIVFEGKNKEYGAYQLRRENPKTTIKAFFLGICLVAALAVLPYFLSSFGTAPNKTDDDEILTLVDTEVFEVPLKKPEPPKTNTTATPPAPIEKPNQPVINNNPTVVEAPQATPDLAEGVDATPASTPGTPGTGTAVPGNPGGGSNPVPAATPAGGTEPHIVVDKMPEYPGGMKKFYEYIKKNFKEPDAEESGNSALKVIVSFVVEKDGSISDIKILRNPGFGMDKEATRVLKALKTKWIPGQIAGQPVRTIYNLPIAIQPQE